LTKADLDAVRDNYKDKVNGILGSVEDLSGRDRAVITKESGQSLAEPMAEPVSSRGESLLDKMKMRKGK
jgi:hypothetical protein